MKFDFKVRTINSETIHPGLGYLVKSANSINLQREYSHQPSHIEYSNISCEICEICENFFWKNMGFFLANLPSNWACSNFAELFRKQTHPHYHLCMRIPESSQLCKIICDAKCRMYFSSSLQFFLNSEVLNSDYAFIDDSVTQ